jgi:hypothetical protein
MEWKSWSGFVNGVKVICDGDGGGDGDDDEGGGAGHKE